MRHIDFAPLYRSTVGFDRLFSLLDSVSGLDQGPTAYPPYNIERLGENEYQITMAVAGFGQDEVRVDVKEQTLTVAGEKKAEEKERQFLHRGIAARSFERGTAIVRRCVSLRGPSFMQPPLRGDIRQGGKRDSGLRRRGAVRCVVAGEDEVPALIFACVM